VVALPRQTVLLAGLSLVGCALLAASVVAAMLDRGGATDAPAPTIEVRARFSNLAPAGASTGFAVAADGSLGVVDRTRQRVVRLDPTGRVVAEWGPRFEDDAAATDLSGLAAGGGDAWYLLDRGRQRVLRLDGSGHAVAAIDLRRLATYGPNGLAVDGRGDLYLADTGGSRILVFGADGVLTRTIGGAGSGLGDLKQPVAIAFGADGAMFVADIERSRVERWDAGLRPARDWTLARQPWGVAADRLGRVFVPDAEDRIVRMFDADGDLLAEIGAPPSAAIPLTSPTQVGVAPDGSALWVLGTDGLARVDLAPLAAVVAPAPGPRPAWPIAGAGAALAVAGLAALGWPALRRQAWPLRLEAPRARGLGAPPARPVEPPSPRLSPATAAVRSASARRPQGLLLAGVALLGLGGLAAGGALRALGDASAKAHPWPLLGVMVGGGIVWAAGSSATARARPEKWLAPWAMAAGAATWPRPGRRAWAGGAAALLGLVAAAAWWRGGFETPDATRAALAWLAALALAAAACTRAAWRRPGILALAVASGLFVVALLPRAWQVADVPFGIWFDEAQGALEIRRVVHQGTYTPILNTYGRDTSGFFYLMPALWVVLGDTIGAARVAASIVGALTVAATYLLGRELFGWRVGLAAAGLLAYSRWHLDFSRLAFNPISLPLCAVLAFWLLARAIRRGGWTDFVLAGLALGAGLHAYTGFRAMPVVAIVALGYAALVRRWPPATLAGRAGLYGGAALLAALPVLIFALQHPTDYNARTVQTLILAAPVDNAEKLRQVWDNVQKHLLMFNVSGDMNGRHNLPGAPMLDPLSGGLVVLGLGWLLLRPRDWRTVLLLAWAGAALASGILTLAFEAPQAARTIAITPVLAVVGGVGLVAALDRLVAVLTIPRVVIPWRARTLAAALGVLAIGWVGYTNLDTFFDRQMNDPTTWAAFSTRETIVAKAAREGRGRYERILGSATLAPSVQAAYLVPDLQGSIRPIDPVGDLPYRGRGPALVYLETEHDQPLADEVARLYPDAVELPARPPRGGETVLEGFRLDPAVLDVHRGGQAAYRGADGATLERAEPRPTLAAGAAPVPLPATVTWRAGLALDASGEYGLRAPAGFEVRVDDAAVPAASGLGVRVRLARGTHPLQLSGTIRPGAAGAGLDWWPPGAADWQPITDRALFRLPPGGVGLRATLAPLPAVDGQPAQEFVDPVVAHYYHVSPFAGANLNPPRWSEEWVGALDAPTTGSYEFDLDHSEHAALWIDRQPVLSDLNAPTARLRASVDLSAGRHALRVRYEKTEDGGPWIYLYWTPPGGQRAVVPGSALYPPPPEPLGPAG
jgi:DNA-binding beta-propeller fold protein YncE